MNRFSLVVCLLLVNATSNCTRAGIVFDIFFRHADFGDSKNATFSFDAGRVFTGTQVIFQETVTAGSVSLLGAANLNAYAVNVGNSGANGSFNTLTLNTAGGFAAGSNDADTLNFAAFGVPFGQPGRSSVDIGGGSREAILGTLNLVAPTAGSTTFTLADFNPGNDGDFTTFASGGAGLESLSAASGGGLFGRTLTITAVPEPSTLALVGIGLAMGAVRRLRSRRKRSVYVLRAG